MYKSTFIRQHSRRIFPGDGRCHLEVELSKWHSLSAVAFLDFVYITDQIHLMTAD